MPPSLPLILSPDFKKYGRSIHVKLSMDEKCMSHDPPQASSPTAVAALAASRAASSPSPPLRLDSGPPLTSEEMLVESQLVAAGLLEPREGSDQLEVSPSASGAFSPTASGAFSPTAASGAFSPQLVTRAIKSEIQRTIQTLISYVERAHGLRIQGMVAEFIQPAPYVLTLIAVHAVQWDSRASRGRLGTFTDRWEDFTSGLGPAPAVRPPAKRNFAPGSALRR